MFVTCRWEGLVAQHETIFQVGGAGCATLDQCLPGGRGLLHNMGKFVGGRGSLHNIVINMGGGLCFYS